MLLLVSWKPFPGNTPADREKGLEIFSRWSPPAGMDIKAMYSRADNGGGFCIVETETAEAAYTATAPWAGSYLEYDIVPIVDIEKAVEICNAAIAFRNG